MSHCGERASCLEPVTPCVDETSHFPRGARLCKLLGAMDYRVDFETLAWEPAAPGVRHKCYRVGSRVLRLVEYSREMEPHWCARGHVGHIVDGILEVEIGGGLITCRAGDALFIPAGDKHRHRAVPLTAWVTALFVEEDAP